MTATDPVQAVMKVLNDEGCAPGHSIHSWRCEDKERYPEPCDCVEDVAREVVATARPLIAAEALRDLHAEMSKWEGYDTRDIGWAFLATLVLEHIEDRADDLEAGR